ncbi:MAG: PDZ domain-containing protein [Kiritimatiellae bacterium]|nr:PDZ domain-containing protein [Kiritimatiellia bacterium]
MRWTGIVLLLLAAGCSALAVPPGGFTLEIEDGLCRLEASEARVNDILAEVSRLTGIPIVTDPADGRTITVSLRDREIEELVDAIASGSVITYAQDPESGRYVIEQIRTSRAEDPETKRRQIEEIERLRKESEWKPPANLQALKYSGIGAGLSFLPNRQGILLYPLSPESPAARAGIQKGSVVVAVDGRPIRDFRSLDEITRAIRGPEGTMVELTVRRGYGVEIPVAVRREVFEYRPPH